MQANFLKAGFFTVVMAAAVIACNSKASDKEQKPQAAPAGLPVDVKVVEESFVDQSEVVAGSIVPNRTVEIAAELPRKLIAVHFKDGAFVREGAMLYKLDDADIKAKIKQLQADLNLAHINEQRLAALLKTESVRREEYDAAYAKLQSLEAAKELLQVELSKTVVRAPFSGIIGISKVFEGSYVVPGAPLVSLQEQHVLKVQFSISEKYLPILKPGARIYFTTTLGSDKITATILSAEASVDAQSRAILVQALFSNTGGKLKPGMSAKVFFNTSSNYAKGMMVPTEALMPGGKGYSVFVVKNGVAAARPVTVSSRNEKEAMINSGITAGDTVIISNILRTTDGTPVTIVSSN
jgi:membrane fusion protein, multidrug efflux system